MRRLRTRIPAILCGTAALLTQSVHSATFTWNNQTGSWGTGTSWVGNTVPPSNIATDLVFGGDVLFSVWAADNNLGTATNPFQLNQIRLQGVDTDNVNSGVQHTITGNTIRFGGIDAEINQAGSANIVFNTPIQFSGGILFTGDGDFVGGAGTVTLNAGISGVGDITKTGLSTFRFGTMPSVVPAQTPSTNTWMGKLVIEGGTVRFNNNAQAAASALRANPVVFNGNGVLSARRDGGDETDGFSTSLRMGTLSGDLGLVTGILEGLNTRNFDIVILALEDGTYGGGITLPKPTGLGDDVGQFVIRGPGTQTLTAGTGDIKIYKDTIVGHGATLVLRDGASLFNDVNPGSGSVTLAGGNLRLDNTGGNTFVSEGRLRDGAVNSSTVDTIGGGKLQLIGHPTTGTSELTGRLQLGAEANLRSGHAIIEVVPTTATGPLTQLTFKSYSRNQSVVLSQLATVEFSAALPNGNLTNLGSTGARIYLTANTAEFIVPTSNSLLSTTGGAASVGWAVVNGPGGAAQFATHGATGVVPISPAIWNTGVSQTNENTQISGSASTPGSGINYQVNSIRMSSSGTLSIGADTLSTTAFLVAEGANYLIQATSGGRIGGIGPRFFHVRGNSELTVEAPLNGSLTPVVKAGEGTMILAANNNTSNIPIAINGGALRGTNNSTLPQGEIRIRGGQLEIVGPGSFSRPLGYGAGTINWAGVEDNGFGVPRPVEQDRGSGGFAAIGGDVNIDIANTTLLSWGDLGFLPSGYALTFGSKSATNRVTMVDNISLSAVDLTEVNYNAREFRVLDSPSLTDSARISGTISGRQTNDLLKTGPGDLELSAINNTYLGATIIHSGRLFVNGNSTSSFLHKVMNGGTLAGRGTVGNVLVDAGGKIAPGAGAGIASILTTKDLQFTDAASKFQFEIGGNIAGGDGITGYDQIKADDGNVATELTVTLNGATLEGTFLNGYLAGMSDIFFLIINDGTDAVQGQFAQGNLVNVGSQTFAISYTANSTTPSMTGGNDVALQLVPEPSTALLLGAGTLLFARRRRQGI